MKFVGAAGYTLLQTKEDQLETSTTEAILFSLLFQEDNCCRRRKFWEVVHKGETLIQYFPKPGSAFRKISNARN